MNGVNLIRQQANPSTQTGMLILLLALIGYAFAQNAYQRLNTPSNTRMNIELPLPVQMALYFGDRYLAANADFFIAEMQVTSQLNEEEMSVFSHYLSQANKLNPYHEEAYYVAAATLPWKKGGDLPACQDILLNASSARTWDWLPLFLHGFNAFYFLKNYDLGAKSMLEAAKRSDDTNKQALSILAGRLYAQAPSDMAIHALKLMANSSQYQPLKQHLLARAEQVRRLLQIEEASSKFEQKHHVRPKHIQDLIKVGFLDHMPVDPMGGHFHISPEGKVQILEPGQ